MRGQPSQPSPSISIDVLIDLVARFSVGPGGELADFVPANSPSPLPKALESGPIQPEAPLRADAGSVRLIDLRPRTAFEEGHLPLASHLAMDEVNRPYLRPPRRRSLVLLAEDPSEARTATRTLVSAGYTACALDAPVSLWPGPWESGPERSPAWEPSPLVGRWAPLLTYRRVCDLACGSGRDAVYLAMFGSRVTAIDILPDALDQARFLAVRHNVEVDFRLGDIEGDPRCWDDSWEGIHVHRFLHRPAFPLLRERLRPGGLLLYETFLEEQARRGRKPSNPAHLLREGELLDAAQGLEVVAYREGSTSDGDWTAALVARKGGPK